VKKQKSSIEGGKQKFAALHRNVSGAQEADFAILQSFASSAGMPGPQPTSNTLSHCCACSRHCRRSLRVRNLKPFELTKRTLRTLIVASPMSRLRSY
jgi:hypothetical protein